MADSPILALRILDGYPSSDPVRLTYEDDGYVHIRQPDPNRDDWVMIPEAAVERLIELLRQVVKEGKEMDGR